MTDMQPLPGAIAAVFPDLDPAAAHALLALGAAVARGRVELGLALEQLADPADTMALAAQLGDQLWPEESHEAPPVAAYYRVTWQKTVTEEHEVRLPAADLVALTRPGIYGPVDADNRESFVQLAEDPMEYNLDETLAELDIAGRGRLLDVQRTEIEIHAVTEEKPV
jgi:hypothetical protein